MDPKYDRFVLPETTLRDLRSAVGVDHVLTDPDVTASFGVDWMRRYRGSAAAVVRPGSTDEAVAVVQILARIGVPIVAQGGNTGLVGGSVPVDGGVVISTRRLQTLGEVDQESLQVTAGAGVTLGRLQRYAAAAGLRFPLDLGARDNATVGGLVATNAGGTSVIRFGMMRSQVLGLEAVLPDGTVVDRLHGLLKDNTGFDVGSILVGSEGTLGLITAARVHLAPLDHATISLGIACAGIEAAVPIVGAFRRAGFVVDAAEVVDAAGLDLVARHLSRTVPAPFASGALLLMDLATAPGSDVETAAGALLDGLGIDLDAVVVATDRYKRQQLWEWRERQTEAIARQGVPVKLDLSLPLPQLGAFAGSVEALLRPIVSGVTVIIFGHLGDGNLHVNVLGVIEHAEQIEDVLLADVIRRGGSISAEHGIGRLKMRWLERQKGSGNMLAMQQVKNALDPKGLWNPNVLFIAT